MFSMMLGDTGCPNTPKCGVCYLENYTDQVILICFTRQICLWEN